MGGLFSSSKPKQIVTLHGNSIFDFSVQQALSADEVSLSTFKGKKAYLVVNVASKWGDEIIVFNQKPFSTFVFSQQA